MIEFSEVIKQGAGTMPLGVENPKVNGVAAGAGTVGRSLDGSHWLKGNGGDTDWGKLSPDLIDPLTEKLRVELLPPEALTPESPHANLTLFTKAADGNTFGAFVEGELTGSDVPADISHASIGRAVTSIGSSAFYYNSLTSATIPDSVTSISNFAFFNNNLLSIVIPDSVTFIGGSAFNGNINLSEVICLVPKTLIDGETNIFEFTAEPLTIRARAADDSWTEGTGLPIGGNTNVTVVKDQ